MAVVLVTGAGSGIGLATAVAFARRGDVVFAGVRDVERAAALTDLALAERLQIRLVLLDVTDETQIRTVVADVIAETGHIDVLVNSAGIGSAGVIEEVDESVARRIFETNLWGAFRMIRAVLPSMRAAASGVIVNVSSINARLASNPGLSIYAMTKHALSFLSETLRDEVQSMGVRVIAAEPGLVATDIYTKSRVPVDLESPYASMMSEIDQAVASLIAGGSDPSVIAAEILAAVEDPNSPARMLMGDDARESFGEPVND